MMRNGPCTTVSTIEGREAEGTCCGASEPDVARLVDGDVEHVVEGEGEQPVNGPGGAGASMQGTLLGKVALARDRFGEGACACLGPREAGR